MDNFRRASFAALALVWKGIDVYSNVDFLLSVGDERLALPLSFFERYGWWLVMVGILLDWLYHREGSPAPAARRRRPFGAWTVAGYSAIAFLFGALFTAALSDPESPRVIEAWGGSSLGCEVQTRLGRIERLSSRFRIAAVCGIEDPRIDYLDDSAISISRSFEIDDNLKRIAIPWTNQMMDKFREPLPPPTTVRGGQRVTVSARLWYRVILIPKGEDTKSIRTLADVKKMNGIVLR